MATCTHLDVQTICVILVLTTICTAECKLVVGFLDLSDDSKYDELNDKVTGNDFSGRDLLLLTQKQKLCDKLMPSVISANQWLGGILNQQDIVTWISVNISEAVLCISQDVWQSFAVAEDRISDPLSNKLNMLTKLKDPRNSKHGNPTDEAYIEEIARTIVYAEPAFLESAKVQGILTKLFPKTRLGIQNKHLFSKVKSGVVFNATSSRKPLVVLVKTKYASSVKETLRFRRNVPSYLVHSLLSSSQTSAQVDTASSSISVSSTSVVVNSATSPLAVTSSLSSSQQASSSVAVSQPSQHVSSSVAVSPSVPSSQNPSSSVAVSPSVRSSQHPSSSVDVSPSMPSSQHPSSSFAVSPSMPSSQHPSSSFAVSLSMPSSQHSSSSFAVSLSMPSSQHVSPSVAVSPSMPSSQHPSSSIDVSPSMPSSQRVSPSDAVSPSMPSSQHGSPSDAVSPSMPSSQHGSPSVAVSPSMASSQHPSSSVAVSPSLPSSQHVSSSVPVSPSMPLSQHTSSSVDVNPSMPSSHHVSSSVPVSPSMPSSQHPSSSVALSPSMPSSQHPSSVAVSPSMPSSQHPLSSVAVSPSMPSSQHLSYSVDVSLTMPSSQHVSSSVLVSPSMPSSQHISTLVAVSPSMPSSQHPSSSIAVSPSMPSSHLLSSESSIVYSAPLSTHLFRPSPSTFVHPVTTVSSTEKPTTATQLKKVIYFISFDGECEKIVSNQETKEQFIMRFKKLVADILSISGENIKINKIACGSVDVTFTVADVTSEDTKVLEKAVNDGRVVVKLDGKPYYATKIEVVNTSPTSDSSSSSDKTLAFWLYISFGAAMGLIFLFGLIILLVRCRRDRVSKTFVLGSNSDMELKRYQGNPRTSYYRVEMYGGPIEADAVRTGIDQEYDGGVLDYAESSYSFSPSKQESFQVDSNPSKTNQDQFAMGNLPEWNVPKLKSSDVVVSETCENNSEGDEDILHAYDNPVMTFGGSSADITSEE